MRFTFSILFVVFALPFAVLAQRENSVCLDTAKNDSADPVILNVCNQGRGMTALPQLRLHFRLYQSGRVEYEVNPDYDPGAGEANHQLILKKTKIDAREVDEIIRLGQESDFQNAKSEYPRFQIWTDSGLETTIVFRNKTSEKKILVNNYSSYDKDNPKHYPPALLKMLRKIDELRPKDR
jgi:hypothetical protein